MAGTLDMAGTPPDVEDSAEVADAELLGQVRGGDRASFGLLYQRHEASARRFARSLVNDPFDADDVVAEVFVSVLATIERGNGPETLFAPYLMNSVRNESYRLLRRRQRETADRRGDAEAAGDHRLAESDPYERVDEAAVVRDAFGTLSGDVKDTLWWTIVEDVSPAEFAGSQGRSAHAGSVTASRARRAFGVAYLHQHLGVDEHQDDPNPECQEVRRQLARHVRGVLGRGRRRRVEAHLERCVSCDEARRSLGRVNRRLRVVPAAPLLFRQFVEFAVQVKAEIAGWVSSATVPIATAGAVAVAVVPPIVADRPSPATEESPPAAHAEPATSRVVLPPPTTVASLPEMALPGDERGGSSQEPVSTEPHVDESPDRVETAQTAPPPVPSTTIEPQEPVSPTTLTSPASPPVEGSESDAPPSGPSATSAGPAPSAPANKPAGQPAKAADADDAEGAAADDGDEEADSRPGRRGARPVSEPSDPPMTGPASHAAARASGGRPHQSRSGEPGPEPPEAAPVAQSAAGTADPEPQQHEAPEATTEP